MDVRSFDDAFLFEREAAAYLDFDPFSSSVIAVEVDRALTGMRNPGPEDRYWTLVNGVQTVGIAMHTPPHNVFLARMPDEAASVLAESLAETQQVLSGVSGERQAVAAFARKWKQLTGKASSTAVSMRMYRLEELVLPVAVPGRGRPAEGGDIDVIAAWLQAFHDEAQPLAPVGDWRTLAEQRISAGQFRVWEDNQTVVSMSGLSNAVAGVSRVGPVYTPPAHRNRGYGAAVTAQATAAAIDAGAVKVVLYTDLSNPTSNAIYQAIGYRPDHDAEERSFHR